MKRRIQLAVGVLALLIAGAQLIRPDCDNPPSDPARSLWRDPKVDPRVAGVLRRACADCHSHETAWPWYAKLSPLSWMLAHHVHKGREKLNFSKWRGATANQMEEIYDAIDKDEMPPKDYRLMHPLARLSTADRQLLKDWADGKPIEQVRGVVYPTGAGRRSR